MPLKLTEEEFAQRNRLATELSEAGAELNKRIAEYNECVRQAAEAMREQQDIYNKLVKDSIDFADRVAMRSEKLYDRMPRDNTTYGKGEIDFIVTWDVFSVRTRAFEMNLPAPIDPIDPQELPAKLQSLPYKAEGEA